MLTSFRAMELSECEKTVEKGTADLLITMYSIHFFKIIPDELIFAITIEDFGTSMTKNETIEN